MSWLLDKLKQITGKQEPVMIDRHTELAKKLIKELRFTEHHLMSEELQKAKSLQEFDAILDKYDATN